MGSLALNWLINEDRDHRVKGTKAVAYKLWNQEMGDITDCLNEINSLVLVTYMSSNWVTIGLSDTGLFSVQHAAITWINDDFILIMALEFYNGSEIDHIITGLNCTWEQTFAFSVHTRLLSNLLYKIHLGGQ